MKPKSIFLILFVFSICSVFSQVPSAINYQAVVRNSSGEVVANKNVSFRISIIKDSENGSIIYIEKHSVLTNNFGLANFKIGQGNVESGVFDPDGWGIAAHFMKIEFDADGGSAFIHLATSQFMSVPYAFHAQTVEEDMVDDADSDPENELQTISLDGNQLMLSDGGAVELPSSEDGDNWGSQTVESDATLSGNGTVANPLSVLGDNWGEQTVKSDATLSGNGTAANPLSAIGDNWGDQTVEADATLSGNGTAADPLSAKGDNWGSQSVTSDATLSGIGTPGSPLRALGDNWGSQVIESDETISGDGTIGNPLTVQGDLSDDQTLSIVGTNLSIAGGNSVTLPTVGGSIWNIDGSDTYFNTGKVGIGKIPGLDKRQFQVDGQSNIAIAGNNNSTYATLFLENEGSGLAAEFRNRIKIKDGTEGYGKIFTSDIYGIGTWQNPFEGFWAEGSNNTISTMKRIVIGKENSVGYFFDLYQTDDFGMRVESENEDAYIKISKGADDKYADIVYSSSNMNMFYTGLLGNNNFRISTSTYSLNGIEVEHDGDVNISDELRGPETGSFNLLPYAYGYILSDGTMNGCTPNVGTVSRAATGQYVINIPDLGSSYTVLVTPNQGYAYLTSVVTSRATSSFSVAIWNTRDDAYFDGGFSFLVYRP